MAHECPIERLCGAGKRGRKDGEDKLEEISWAWYLQPGRHNECNGADVSTVSSHLISCGADLGDNQTHYLRKFLIFKTGEQKKVDCFHQILLVLMKYSHLKNINTI